MVGVDIAAAAAIDVEIVAGVVFGLVVVDIAAAAALAVVFFCLWAFLPSRLSLPCLCSLLTPHMGVFAKYFEVYRWAENQFWSGFMWSYLPVEN